MTVKFDRSYIKSNTRELIDRGYAREMLNQLVFRFEYTEEQKAKNRAMAASLSKEARKALVGREAIHRSSLMEPAMKAISEEFVCCQYNQEADIAYLSTDWDLYFYCRRFDVPGTEDFALDLSYFMLSFNREHAAEQRSVICDRVIRLLKERFADHPNLHVSVQYMGWLDSEKIQRSVQQALPALSGKRCVYHGYEGRLALDGDNIFSLKKRARKQRYRLSQADALLLSLDLAVS